jgi:hypothetical protein
MPKGVNMQVNQRTGALALGFFIFLGLSSLGLILANAAIDVKQYDRVVTVKGLAEREYKADIVIWPIAFSVAENDVQTLYSSIDDNSQTIKRFLIKNGIQDSEISFSTPNITDKSAQSYGNGPKPEFRFIARQTVTVYSKNVDGVRQVMGELSALGKEGIVLTGGGYEGQTEYIFTRLNDVKPEMIEEATKKARQVAEKFAADSDSKLGKIKRASQGQFSIRARDRNNPQIKKVRVVSTVEYYLSD